jgi:hypothetical protein
MGLKNKRGMFFIFVAIVLLTISLASLTIFSEIKNRESVVSRIGSMNNFVFSLEEDLDRKLFITGFRIIFLHEKRIVDSGNYIVNVSASFKEAFFNGTIEGSSTSDEDTLLAGVKYQDIIDDLNENANKLSLRVNFSDPVVSITQDDPWNVKVILEGFMFVEDIGGLAYWNKSVRVESLIPTENFEDPLYIVNTNARVVPKISQTPYSNFVVGSDVTKLSDHLENMYYLASNESPSFLQRLEGDISAHEQGVESLVDLDALSAQGLSIEDKSIVDHIYFSGSNPSANAVSGMPFWFKLDSAHHDLYNVSGIIV